MNGKQEQTGGQVAVGKIVETNRELGKLGKSLEEIKTYEEVQFKR